MSDADPSPPKDPQPAPKRPAGQDPDRKHQVDQYERPPVDDPDPADPDA